MALLDQYGRPIMLADLSEPQTAKVAWLQNSIAGHPAKGLTPAKLSRLLSDAESGDITAQHELFADMEERDAHLYAEMGKRRRALLTLPFSVSGADERLAQAANEFIFGLAEFEDLLFDLTDAIGHGFVNLEIEWKPINKQWRPVGFTHRPQSWFCLTKGELRLQDGSVGGSPLTPFGWISHTHKARSGDLARAGLMRVLAWPYVFKHFALRDLSEFLEIYGLPMRLGVYGAGASEAEKATLLQAVAAIGRHAAGIIPENMRVEFEEAAKGAHDPFVAMIDICERSVSKAVLGGTLTSQADGKSSTNALGNVHNEVRRDLLVSDARQVAGTVTRQLLYPYLALNFGLSDPEQCPRFAFDTREIADLNQLATAIPALAAGMPIPLSWAHEKTGIPAPKEGEPVFGATAHKTPLARSRERGGGEGKSAALAALRTGAAAAEDETDTADRLLPGASSLADPHISQWIASIEATLAQCASLADFRDRLLMLYGHLPAESLATVMAKAFAVAELHGRLEVRSGE